MRRFNEITYVLTDVFLIAVVALAVFLVRFVPQWRPNPSPAPGVHHVPPAEHYLGFLLLYGLLTLIFCQEQRLYSTSLTRSGVDETASVAMAVLYATVVLATFIYLSKVEISRLVVGVSGMLNVITLAGWRLWRRRSIVRRVMAGCGLRNVLIIGADKLGREVARCLEADKHLGITVKGFVDHNHHDRLADPTILGGVESLSEIARAHFIDEVFVAVPSERELVKRVAVEARRNRLGVKIVPDPYDGIGWRAPIEQVGDLAVIDLHNEPIPIWGLLLKRVLDILVSAVALVLLAPLLAFLAIAIKLDSPGPALYPGVRVGKKGRRFVCHKFRTMVSNADELKQTLRHLNERQGPFFKITDDPRLTRVGKFLRKYSLDEVPQLLNVLKGEMSLVGPRPHPTDDFEQYTLEHLRRLDVTPGISGLWQITARHDPSFERNLALDLEYIQTWNLWLDLKILLKTIPSVLNGAGQ
jgi:exopolysaccharide biosynthesis polyprenyl glycosylphosphotransferase